MTPLTVETVTASVNLHKRFYYKLSILFYSLETMNITTAKRLVVEQFVQFEHVYK